MTPRVTAVVVTYRPDVPATRILLEALAPQVERVVVVDNGSSPDAVDDLRGTLETLDVPSELIPLASNLGIAAAQNIGITSARSQDAELVLLSDQDSVPAPDMVDRLVAGMERAAARSEPVAAVGPVTVDERAKGATLLFSAQRWGPRRAAVPDAEGALVPVAFLLASGCLVRMDVLDVVGPMNEAWFIDHIDLEWGLRATRAGYAMYGVTGAYLRHHLGDRTVRLPGRERDVHIHSPVRNYYMVRNTLLLVRSGLLPTRWRVGYVAWIVKYAGFYAVGVRPRGERIRLMLRGLLHAVGKRTGPLT